MRLAGDDMIIGLKQSFKLIGIVIVSFCAVFVCTLFLNFNLDIVTIKDMLSSPEMAAMYDAQIATGKVTVAVSGGCLLATSVVMLSFYIKHYISSHKKELGILKALGYNNLKIAKGFWTFGLSVLAGTAAGFGASMAIMPTFYKVMNEDNIFPSFSVRFHPLLMLCLVVLPTLFFSAGSVLYAAYKLNSPVLELLRETQKSPAKKRNRKGRAVEKPFLKELRQTTVKSRASLVFFIGFAAFCYADMMQMSFSMKELASEMMAVMIILIGIVLACTTLFLAVTTVIQSNTKTIAMMRSMGYSMKEAGTAILGGYRPVAYIGFAIGTVYQYALLKIMVTVVFKDIGNVPDYHFDVTAFFVTMASFLLIYELVMYCYSVRIKKISIKEIMLD